VAENWRRIEPVRNLYIFSRNLIYTNDSYVNILKLNQQPKLLIIQSTMELSQTKMDDQISINSEFNALDFNLFFYNLTKGNVISSLGWVTCRSVIGDRSMK
jgi:hypothetical protein